MARQMELKTQIEAVTASINVLAAKKLMEAETKAANSRKKPGGSYLQLIVGAKGLEVGLPGQGVRPRP